MTFSLKILTAFAALSILGFLSFDFDTDAQTRRTPARPRPTATPAAKELSPEAIAKRVMPSVVAIRMTNADGSKSKSGSGFFISNDVIVTNFHVIEGMTSGTVKIVGNTSTYSITGVVGYDKDTDLALLQISATVGKPLALALGERPAVGASVYAIGNPRGLEGTFSPGIVSGLRDFSDGSLIQITAPISPGSSGGPVVNNKAEVVGIAVGGFESGQALNFAIPVATLKYLQSSTHSSVTISHAGRNLAKPSREVAVVAPSQPIMIPIPSPTPIPIVIPTPLPTPASTPRIVESPPPPRVEVTEADQLFWNEIVKQNTEAAYELYLRERPNGAYAREAKGRIEEFLVKKEEDAWNAAVAANTKSAFETFLKEHPVSLPWRSSDAREMIKQLGREEEDKLWRAAEEQRNDAAYIRYLRYSPAGVYASIARARLSASGFSLRMSKGAIGTFVTNSFGMELVWIPSGSFMMGSPSTKQHRVFYRDEKPQRRVTIRQGFWMGRFEVTLEQYAAVMGSTLEEWEIKCKNCPVSAVSWDDAKEFIKRLNAWNDGFVYSLPSEAEWEYAARAGTTTDFAFGDSIRTSQANFDGGSFSDSKTEEGPWLGRIASVGSYQPNAWGLYDMHGNVQEWVEDVYHDSYDGLPTDGSANTMTGDRSRRVLRGGSWRANILGSLALRSAARRSMVKDYVDEGNESGFRVIARPR